MSDALHTDRLVVLFVPGNRPERFGKALAAGADAVIIDLEDAVAATEKAAARAAISANWPREGRLLMRINGRATPFFADDLALARELRPAGIMLPKTEHAECISAVHAAVPGVPVIALIETALGLANARAIAATHGVVRLAFGSIDFCADLGIAHTREALLMARSELMLASRLAGRAGPLDGVTTSISDAVAAQEDAAYAASLGFTGKLCIHPNQITPVIRGFAPGADEIAWARRILEAMDAGAGALQVDGMMVDAPVRIRAEGILKRAAALPDA
ncbi:citryl-CoA lyase [Azorhizobium oxalatiphilum]|uniref:Citryl-CoA lyase n=1 Tax=Azorhizobium oxalatiphilum TaxID=980631 RepID=A0A917BR03_9HYPH|nr:CoA ester lyase [Azorhizobium oxalatiphilum]GGF55783.1 citryl-CoA lyase [Azorhizobium oxalatiphilum]